MGKLGQTPPAGWWLLASGLGLVLCTGAQPAELRLGFLIPWESAPRSLGPFITPAILRAVEAVNARDDVLNNTELKWVWHDSKCEVFATAAAFMDLILKYEVSGIIGPACNDPAFYSAIIAENWGIPFISYAADSVLLTYKGISAPLTIARVNPGPHDLLPSFFSLAAAKNWTTIAAVYTIDLDWSALGVAFLQFILPLYPNIGVGFHIALEPTTTTNAGHTLEYMSELKASGVRVVFFMGTCIDTRSLLLAAKRLDMIDGYSYVLLNASPTCHAVSGSGWPSGWGPEANEEAAEAFNNTINIAPLPFESAESTAFAAQMVTDFATQRFDPYRFPPAGDITPSEAVLQNPLNLSYAIDTTADYGPDELTAAAMLYDAVLTYALAADAVIAEGGDPASYQSIQQKLLSTSYVGLTGPVILSPFYDRVTGAIYQNIVYQPGTTLGFENVAMFNIFSSTYTEFAAMRHPGGRTDTPPSFVPPPCELSDYDVSTETCNSNGDVEVVFTVRSGAACSDVNHPKASAECAYVPEDTIFGQATLACACIGILVCIGFLGWLCQYRENDLLRLSQPQLAGVCILGCLMLNVSSLFTVGQQGRPACTVAPRIFHLSFTVAITALITKLYRVWRIFENRKLKKVRIRIEDMFLVVAFFVFLDIAFLTLSTVVSPLHTSYETETTDGASVQIEQLRCQGGGVFIYMQWGVKIALLLGTCLLAWPTPCCCRRSSAALP